jgi:hypothetical protein
VRGRGNWLGLRRAHERRRRSTLATAARLPVLCDDAGVNVSRIALVALVVAGCAFHIESVDVDVAADRDLQEPAAADLASAVDQLSDGAADGATACDPGGTDDQCSADQQSILRCRADGSGFAATVCDYGCTVLGGYPHCARLEPSGVAQGSDCETAAASPTITSNVLLNTDDGSIVGGLNRSPGEGLKNGIFFRLATQGAGPKVGIFGFAGLTTAQGIVVHARGAAALAIVSSADVSLSGTIDLQDGCSTATLPAGAGAGGTATDGGGTGAGGLGSTDIGGKSSGGGGGGHGDVGGAGGASMVAAGRAGAMFGDLSVEPLVLEGGGGGGAGGAGGAGGNGGGALQIAVNGTLTLKGTIHAGGCGGDGGGASGSGGGGGAGGAILLEAAHVVMVGGSVVAANGGGGGAGGGTGAGADATASNGPAAGGSGVAQGGSGGATGSTAGKTAPTGTKLSGGGGGAVGRIVIKTRDGSVDDQGAVWSPALGDVNAAGKSPSALVRAAFQ